MMDKTWRVCQVEDIAAQSPRALAMGPFGSRITKNNFVAQGVPVIRGVNISSGRFYPYSFVYLSDSKADELIASVALPGDLVFTHRGTLGQVGIVPKFPHPRYIVSQSQMKLTCDSNLALPLFMFYYFSSKGKTELLKHVSGSGVPAIASPLSTLRNLKIQIPPLFTQNKIAAILSAYDDLIENNLRRIKILEEMAQNLYREWFVNFRFPGHEQTRFVDSPLGKIPEGWEIVKVEQIVKRVPSGKKYNQYTVNVTGNVPVLDQGRSGIIGYHDDEPGVIASEYSPIIVFANHTCYQRLVMFPFSAIQNVLPFLPNPQYQRDIYWLHHATKDLVVFNDYKGHWPELMAKHIYLPQSLICEQFGGYVEPLTQLVFRLENKISILRQTRDLLLPKLISGEVEVSDLDIYLPEEALV